MRGVTPSLLIGIALLLPSLDCFAYTCLQVYIGANRYAATSSGASSTAAFLAPSTYQTGLDPAYSTNCAVGSGVFNIFGFDQTELRTYKNNLTTISDHTTSINSLTNSVNSFSSDINSLKTDNTTNKNDISALKTDVQNLKNSASSGSSTASNYDYVQAAEFWGAAFASVLSLYIVASMIGTVIDAVRRF